MNVATGIAQHSQASAKVAVNAVSSAIKKAKFTSTNGVILYLTAEMLPHLKDALQQIATLTSCTQIMGCFASGIFTEEDWVLDCPAAAAMVFGGSNHLTLAKEASSQQPLMTWLSPNGIFHEMKNDKTPHYGGIAGDANGQGQFAVWQNAKGELTRQINTVISHTTLNTVICHGLETISTPARVNDCRGFDVISINQMSAQQHLINTWQAYHPDEICPPLASFTLLYAQDQASLINGDCSQATIISQNAQDHSLTLSCPLKPNHYVCWAVRNLASQQQDLMDTISGLCDQQHTQKPDFGLIFSSINRGPFADGIDHDLAILTKVFPKVPLMGFYGNGTIACINNQNQLLSHSMIINMFKADAK